MNRAGNEIAALGPQWANLARSFVEDELCCVRCGTVFHEAENIGAWRCAQHASFALPPVGDAWPCCDKQRRAIGGNGSGSRPWSDGCVAADHTTLHARFTELHDVPMPYAVMNLLTRARNDALVEDEGAATCGQDDAAVLGVPVFRRYDWRAERVMRGRSLNPTLSGVAPHWNALEPRPQQTTPFALKPGDVSTLPYGSQRAMNARTQR